MKRWSVVTSFGLSGLAGAWMLACTLLPASATPPQTPSAQTPPGGGASSMPGEIIDDLGKPGPEHQWLARHAGRYVGEQTVRDGADEPPRTEKTDLLIKVLLGGRFLRLTTTDQTPDGPRVSIGTLGFDRAQNRYQIQWISEFSTEIADPQVGVRNGQTIRFGNPDEAGISQILTIAEDGSILYEDTIVEPDGRRWNGISARYRPAGR